MSQEPKLWLKRNLRPVIQHLISDNPNYSEILYSLNEILVNGREQVPLTTTGGEELVTSSGDPLMGLFSVDSEYNDYLINAYIVIFLLNKGSVGEIEDIIERYKS